MYNSLFEIQHEWPLGTVVAEEPTFQRFYCTDEVTFNKIKEWCNGDEVRQTSPHVATATHLSKKTIEGYLYNGEQWFPMTRNGAEWSIYLPETS